MNHVLRERETLLGKSLLEKELLLKEIHHRVKNNLQLIISLLAIQGLNDSSGNRQLQEFMKKGESRIRAMALIHEILYQTEGVERINFKDYINRLINALKQSMVTETAEVAFDIKMPTVHFNLEKSLCLGLIIHEILTNSLKHAFPNNTGTITLKVDKKQDKLSLDIKDNGSGFERTTKTTGSIGLLLIELLTSRIKGRYSLKSNPGTHYEIMIPC